MRTHLALSLPALAAAALQAGAAAPVFVENLGQWESCARFVGRAGGVELAVEPGALLSPCASGTRA